MSTLELLIAWLAWQESDPELREGQALFNALCEYDPPAAELIRGTADDPFYDDSRINACLLRVIDIWRARS